MTHGLTECSLVSDLRTEFQPSEGDDNSLAEFFKRVVARHMDLEGYE